MARSFRYPAYAALDIFDVYYYEHLDYFGVRPVIEIPITEL